MIEDILKHVCVVKLSHKVSFCFPRTGYNSITLIFLFDCQDMKPNIPTCFLKDSICILQVVYFNVIHKIQKQMCREKKTLLHDCTM